MPLSFWGDIGKWAGGFLSPASNTAGDGSRVMPDARITPRRIGQILTVAPLPANGSYISQWFDVNQTGDFVVFSGVKADQNGAGGTSYFLEQTDDVSNPAFIATVSSLAYFGGTFRTVSGPITSRYWRLRFVNGAVAQSNFELTFVTSPNFAPATASLAVGSSQAVLTTQLIQPITAVPGTFDNITSGLNQPVVYSTGISQGAIFQAAVPHIYNGASWDRNRTPIIFKTATAVNAGNTAAWTPAAGKKFRLMRYQIELTENATLAVAAVVTVKFQDNVTDFAFQHDQYIPAAAGVATGEAWRSGWIDMGNGYISLVANNVLNFNIGGGANLTAGQFRINVCGTEE